MIGKLLYLYAGREEMNSCWECKQFQETGIENGELKFDRGYLRKLLHGQCDSTRVYLEKIQTSILSLEIRKKMAIREKSNI